MKLKNLFSLVTALALFTGQAQASTLRAVNADTITNTTGGSSLAVPSSGGNLLSDSASATLTNKTMSGASNTFTNIPQSAVTGLSGSNSGDVTIGTANGLSLVGQQLSLGVATNSVAGALSAADHTTFAAQFTLPSGGTTAQYLNGLGALTNFNTSVGSYLSTLYGANNGIPQLDSSGKIQVANLPSVVMEYQQAWNPSTNSPALADSGCITAVNGNVYRVSTAFTGAVSGLSDPSMAVFYVGDLVICSATAGKWQRAPSADGVTSVNGAVGAVTVNAINQITGDIAAGPASGSQSVVGTLATTGVTAGTYSNPGSVQVDAKGRVLAISNGTGPAPAVTGTRASPTAITAAGGISFSSSSTNNVAFIQGSAGAVTVTANPQIVVGSIVGQQLLLIGRSATNTVTLADGNGLSLNGGIVLGLDSQLLLVWDGTNWVESARR